VPIRSWGPRVNGNGFQSEDRERFLRWLRYGADLAKEIYKDEADHRKVIWILIVDAVDLVDRLDDQERRWLDKGKRGQSWNITQTLPEAVQTEILRIMCAMKPAEGVPRYRPQGIDHERMLDVLSWLRWTNGTREPKRLQMAAIEVARGMPRDVVLRAYRPREKVSRKVHYEIKKRVTDHILEGLKDLGIVPGRGISFTEVGNVKD
jgi:hypothetical protein